MKSIKKYITGAAALVASGVLLSSCEKTFDATIPLNAGLDNNAIVQVYMATVNTARNYVYVDSKPVTGAAIFSNKIIHLDLMKVIDW